MKISERVLFFGVATILALLNPSMHWWGSLIFWIVAIVMFVSLQVVVENRIDAERAQIDEQMREYVDSQIQAWKSR